MYTTQVFVLVKGFEQRGKNVIGNRRSDLARVSRTNTNVEKVTEVMRND
jgi:hypothetical protein